MKNKALLMIMIFVPFFLMAQKNIQINMPEIPLDEKGKIKYVEVVKEDATKDELFKRCVRWINTEYKNPNSVISTRDMVNGKIEIHHQFRVYNTLESGTKTIAGTVLYKMIIRFKEGRYRVQMDDFIIKKTIRTDAEIWLDESHAEYSPSYATQLNDFSLAIIASMKKGMVPKKEYVEEEW